MKKKSEVLTEQMREKWGEIVQIRDQVVEEERDFTDQEQGQVEKALDEVREIEKAREKELKEESMIDQIEQYDQFFSQKKAAPASRFTPKEKASRLLSLGSQFVESQEWKSYFETIANNGKIAESRKGISSPAIPIKGLMESLIRKTLLTGSSDTSAGAFVEVDYSRIYEPLGRYPLTLRDLISVRQTGSDTVEFVRQTAQVTQTEAVPEANVTDYTGATGEVSGEKPEAAMAFERVQAIVKTLAVWIPATKRALSDVPQLRGLIDDELISDLQEEFEDQLLNGDGIGENFTGLSETAGTLVQAFDTDIAVTARKAITNLLINGKQIPTAYLFNPQDWESYDLLQDDNGRYYWGGPMMQGQRTLWGVPVAQSFFQDQGSGWLANWRKMVVWDREEAMISASDSHEDFFIRNMVAILGEMRAAMGVIRPSAFVEMDLTSGS